MILIALCAFSLAGCTETVVVDQNGKPIPRRIMPIKIVQDATTGCLINVFYDIDGDSYTQRFRADGKPDCPNVE